MNLVGFPSRFNYKDYDVSSPSNGLSCNEFIIFILRVVQKSFPSLIIPEDIKYVNDMWDKLGVTVSDKFAKPGDLVFYSHYGDAPKHVGIYFGTSEDGDRYMIDSEGETGGHIVFSKISDNYRHKKQTKDTLYAKGLLGYKRITMMTTNFRWPQSPIK
ncbi:MAG: hypothetical protein ACD_19C00426G0084 [uncultured bacterium]|nr:MAG: hypothetical protein ACD_19C00426G0084 [uncultured bacterium]